MSMKLEQQFNDVRRGGEVTLCQIEKRELQERRAIILGVIAAVVMTVILWGGGLLLLRGGAL
jgi:hypothetical protein